MRGAVDSGHLCIMIHLLDIPQLAFSLLNIAKKDIKVFNMKLYDYYDIIQNRKHVLVMAQLNIDR